MTENAIFYIVETLNKLEFRLAKEVDSLSRTNLERIN